ncbi:uncharacterized [Tachysurus ichikawai]
MSTAVMLGLNITSLQMRQLSTSNFNSGDPVTQPASGPFRIRAHVRRDRRRMNYEQTLAYFIDANSQKLLR